jgi:hypothetical protein
MGIEETKDETESMEELEQNPKKRRYSLIPNSKRKSMNASSGVLKDRSNLSDSVEETEKHAKKQKVYPATDSEKGLGLGLGVGVGGDENYPLSIQSKLRGNSMTSTRRLANRAL